ncbi:MAG: SIS domain-containing protein [Candidatus Azotimanducaceae bacterium]|uniref:SIS domain-containing protein n=1 Tax=OM182 bacterium TaxID=2510334 RepID=A0A520S3R9_9GAMM|nr:capsule biosynthesis protein [Gammaproteobacteria bacterium]OUV67623.1 MAG: capsule biosynthesis protein [Gammaproteobacteria bacterium TMED133]RZO77089.1 MAG: SIS domain-containing protein [OM182 bacterium]
MNIKENIAAIIEKEANAMKAINITDAFEDAVNVLFKCKGRIVTTGIGKAGFMAHKFASTLSSTGTPAFFVHPAEAGHGDMGMIDRNDLIVAFSTSGKSTEVIEMLQIAKDLGIHGVIGITSHVESPLRELSEIILDMGPDIEEPCPLNLTPSATIAVMLGISDALALTLMELRGFTASDYGQRHHRGYLGSITRATQNSEEF